MPLGISTIIGVKEIEEEEEEEEEGNTTHINGIYCKHFGSLCYWCSIPSTNKSNFREDSIGYLQNIYFLTTGRHLIISRKFKNTFDTNTGLYERKKLIGNSKSLDMEGMLFHDLFEMDRYLMNMVDVKLKLFRSKPSFCLMSSEDDADYDVVIEDIVVKVCKIKVNPAIIFAHSEALKSTNAKYPYTKTVMKHITLMMGSTNAVLENIFQDVKPKRIIMGLTSTNAVNGDYQLNPWNFQHFDLQQITLYCDGVPVDGIPLKL
ncbi:unnamed protein product [Mytilus edulis]|uniref:Uncharacterized protein n=1 Tax=Mytilus edulis TaxID=6550 RepID=A0A8S3ULD7_MYTED|nr:unnamed protein product [Mytilus edulis]